MEEQKINVSINDGEAFFAHELSINFNPTQFTLDFKNITPRVDMRNPERPSILLKHNVVMVEPWHLKMVHELMGKVIKRYEDEFGKIEKPQSIKEFEKKKKKSDGTNKSETEAPSYFG